MRRIKKHKIKTGIALNPNTQIKVLKPYLKKVDFFSLMTVNPGFGGQVFINSQIKKIIELNTLIKKTNSTKLNKYVIFDM